MNRNLYYIFYLGPKNHHQQYYVNNIRKIKNNSLNMHGPRFYRTVRGAVNSSQDEILCAIRNVDMVCIALKDQPWLLLHLL